jgi:hypothetical protein
MQQKISWTDGRMERRKTVYSPSPFGERGYNKTHCHHITEIVLQVALYTYNLIKNIKFIKASEMHKPNHFKCIIKIPYKQF